MQKQKNYCTFYIVRHGETEWNVKGKLQGHFDSPLTKHGEKQAQKTGEFLKNINFKEAYSSDLLRAKRTAELITLERNIVVKTTQVLRERTYGVYEGKTREDLKGLLEEYEKLSYQERYAKSFAPGVEADEVLATRFITFLREVAVAYIGENILVVSHGGIMRALLYHLGFGNPDTLPALAIKNTAIIVLLVDGVDFFIKETKGIISKKTT